MQTKSTENKSSHVSGNSHYQKTSAQKSGGEQHGLISRMPGNQTSGLSQLIHLGAAPIQPKLKVSTPGDPYEQEADAMAERVMTMPESAVQRAGQPEEKEELQAKPLLQRQPDEEEPVQMQEEKEEELVQTQEMKEEEPVQMQEEEEEEQVQLQPMGEEEEPIQTQEMEEEEEPVQMQEEEEEELIQPQPLEEEEEIVQAQELEEEEAPIQAQEEKEEEALQMQEEEEEEIQAQGETPGAGPVSPVNLRERLQAERGGGRPLPDSTRTFMEDRLSADFSRVRIHTGPAASELSGELRAQAFTRGSDIFFNEGRYNPETSGGRRLLAHELTHVVQQGAAGPGPDAETVRPAAPGSGAETPARKESSETPDGSRAATGGSPAATGQVAPETGITSTVSAETQPPETAGAGAESEGKVTEEAPAETEGEGGTGRTGPGVSGGAGEGAAAGESPPGTAPEEQVAPQEASTEQTVEAFTQASATNMARTLPSLGDNLNEKLTREQEQTAEETPDLKASTQGVEEIETPESQGPESRSADIPEGTTEQEPTPETPEEIENAGEPPKNDDRVEQAERQADTGFLSWLRSNINSFISGISTSDPGVNTSAGERPRVGTTGKADPMRADRQKAEGKGQVTDQQAQTNRAIQENKGKEKIQPVKVDEKKEVSIPTERKVSVETSADENIGHYANREDLTPAVRQAADKKMAPQLEQSLSGPRKEVAAAAQKRDQDKDKEISKAKQETAELNKKARDDQDQEVQTSRREVAAKQQEGIEEADRKMQEFDQEANTKETEAKKAIDDRIKEDEGEAAKKLSDAEKEAEKKKKEAEKKARAKKQELEEKKEEQSWWDRAVSAVKSAVKAITSAIDAIFTAVRDAVKTIINAARDAALAVIEAGRKWITEKLDQFATWLKEKVTQYIGAVFPALAERINRAIDNTVNRAKAAVNAIADRLKAGVKALADKLSSAIDSILSKFQTALKAAVQIVGAVLTGDFAEAAKIAFMAVCEVAGINPQPILDFINKAGDTLATIFKDPVGFFMNVINGVKKGLQQFRDNIRKHLITGLIGWLTGTLSEAGITLPEKWDLKGIFHLVMQILGLTYQNIRAKVVKKLGPRGEQIVSTIEKTVDFVQDFIKRGPVALWDRVKSFLGNIKETVLSGIRDWVVTQVVKQGIMWLFSLLNPASAIVRAIKLLYDVVMFFVNRWNQIVSFAQSIFNSVRELALGQLGRAANAVEQAMARSIPVIISFLASLLGLGGIGKAVKKIIMKIRKPIDKALDKVIGWIVDKGKALLKMGKAAVQKGVQGVKKLLFPSKSFKAGKQSHKIWVKEGTTPQLMISSETKLVDSFIANLKNRDDIPEDKKKKIPQAQKVADEMKPKLKKIKQLEDAGKDTTKVQRQVIDLEMKLADLLSDILIYDNPLESKERYKLEGHVATYGNMPQVKFDKLTPDHQPQAALLKHVASMNEFKGRQVQNVIKGKHVDGGYAINLHEIRHKAGRTFGSKGGTTLENAKTDIRGKFQNIPAGHTEKRRNAVLDVVRSETEKDVSAMNTVVNDKANFRDIMNMTSITEKSEKEQLRDDVRSKIKSGESRIKAQNFNRLKKNA